MIMERVFKFIVEFYIDMDHPLCDDSDEDVEKSLVSLLNDSIEDEDPLIMYRIKKFNHNV